MAEETYRLHFTEVELQEYLDGRFSTAGGEQLAQHIGICEACRARLARLEDLFKQIESIPELETRLDLSPAVVNAIRSDQKSWAAGRWLLGFQALIALILLFFSRTLFSQLAELEPGFITLSVLDLISWGDQTLTPLALQLNDIITTVLDTLLASVNGLPTTPGGFSFWAIAAVGGVLWLVVHFTILRPSQNDNNGDRA